MSNRNALLFLENGATSVRDWRVIRGFCKSKNILMHIAGDVSSKQLRQFLSLTAGNAMWEILTAFEQSHASLAGPEQHAGFCIDTSQGS